MTCPNHRGILPGGGASEGWEDDRKAKMSLEGRASGAEMVEGLVRLSIVTWGG